MPAEAATTSGAALLNPGESALSAWQRLTFGSMRLLLRTLLTLFSFRGLYLIGQGFGTLEWLVNYKRRRQFRRRLKRISGEAITPAERRRYARRFFMRTRCDKIFYLILDRIPREKAVARFHIQNRPLMDDALANGNGCFVALSHFGPHHVAALLMALLDYKVAGVRDPHEGGIRRYVRGLIAQRHPEFQRMRMLSADAYPRDIYRCLQENHALGAALDVHRIRDERKRTARVTLFGQQRDFLVGTVQIALRCHSGLLQGFLISEPNFHYRLDLIGPLAPPDAEESPELLQKIMQTYADNIEQYVRKHPDHVSRV